MYGSTSGVGRTLIDMDGFKRYHAVELLLMVAPIKPVFRV